jgi:hypothetical protein
VGALAAEGVRPDAYREGKCQATREEFEDEGAMVADLLKRRISRARRAGPYEC